MELAKIEKLIIKYLEAETTLEEERILKNYFSKDDIPLHLVEYKKLFNYYSNSSSDISTKSISLPQSSLSLRWLSVAAMVILFVSTFSIYQKNITEKEEARLAYVETQKALELISYNLNKGSGAIAQLQTFENTQNKIFKNK
ncbi:MAG: hypothetical protein KAH72_04555 [Flavobacteriaceae bacterium]|nr:hypothetical protein [Flavobacteriaceae bacterium]